MVAALHMKLHAGNLIARNNSALSEHAVPDMCGEGKTRLDGLLLVVATVTLFLPLGSARQATRKGLGV